MDILDVLMNATIKDIEGYEYGEVLSIHYSSGKLIIVIDSDDEEENGDSNGGEKKAKPTMKLVDLASIKKGA